MGKLRAIPQVSTKYFFVKVRPGKIDKSKVVTKLREELGKKFSEQDILSALPAGGVEII